VLTYLVATASPAELPACGGASSLAAVSPSNPAAPPLTANQMHPLGPLLRSRVKAQLPALAAAMLGKMALDAASTPGAGDDGEASLRHPGRYVCFYAAAAVAAAATTTPTRYCCYCCAYYAHLAFTTAMTTNAVLLLLLTNSPASPSLGT